jgi:GH25 family lysozyme M1 (1,4-beta-N-acetylmuramidase)
VTLPRLRRLSAALVTAGLLGLPTLVGGADASAAGAIDGPDVSSYQHPYGAAIKWAAVAKTGKEFAIVKATESTSYTNPWFKTDYWRIRQAGMVRGSYHFARPAYPIASTALAQARYYVHRLGTTARMSRTLPPALDLEMTGGLGRGALVTWAQTFLLNVRRLTGRTPMLYTYPSFWTSALGDPVALARYPLWMASYGSGVDSSASLWQYTSSASVRGIRGSVDMSKLVATSQRWRALSDGRTRTRWPAQVPGPPQSVWAKARAGRATVTWLPGDTGSTSLKSYRVTASPGGASVVVAGTQTSVTMTGLHNGTSYTFTVRGISAVGAGADSLATGAVTPMVPTTLTMQVASSSVYGKAVRVRATLSRPDTGARLAGRTVQVQTRPVGTSAWGRAVDVVTNDKGRATAWLRPASDVDVRVSYTGPVGWSPSRARSRLLVATGVSATLSATEVPLGTPVVLTGAIDPASVGVPVTEQIWRSGSWHVVQTAVTDATGAFSFAVAPVMAGVKHYRVVVGALDGREPGTSAVVTLTVDPAIA